MGTVTYQAGTPSARTDVTGQIEDAARRCSGNYVISSGFRPGAGSLHGKRLAADISLRQSSGDLNELYDQLLLQNPPPDELFFGDRLMDKGQTFSDPELTADHLDHLHVGWDSPPGKPSSTLVVSDTEEGVYGKKGLGIGSAIAFLFDERGIIRIAGVVLGFGALILGIVALMVDSVRNTGPGGAAVSVATRGAL